MAATVAPAAIGKLRVRRHARDAQKPPRLGHTCMLSANDAVSLWARFKSHLPHHFHEGNWLESCLTDNVLITCTPVVYVWSDKRAQSTKDLGPSMCVAFAQHTISPYIGCRIFVYKIALIPAMMSSAS